MKHVTKRDDVLVVITHGSHLYGTSTPDSDWDFKAVYLPSKKSTLLHEPLKVFRHKYDAEGNPLSEGTTMPKDGYEVEYTPVQKFVQDYVDGQAYAVEFIFAVLAGAHWKHAPHPAMRDAYKRFEDFTWFCEMLAERYVHANVDGMVGFAMKQTFDYVHRAERLAKARQTLADLDHCMTFTSGDPKVVRLDTVITIPGYAPMTIRKAMVNSNKLEEGMLVQHEKEVPTLLLNGREYMETSPVWDFRKALEKLIAKYGDRVEGVGGQKVEWKSMSHAVRVYQQVLEVLATGKVTYPRPQAPELVRIKKGEYELEHVKEMLRALDLQVLAAVESTKLRKVDEAFREEVKNHLFLWLCTMYNHM